MAEIEMLQRDEIYRLLHDTLEGYSKQFQSVDIEIFAYEMESPPGGTDSRDPALLDEFSKLVPQCVEAREAFDLVADYLQKELIELRHLDIGKTIVDDFRRAANRADGESDILRRWLGR
jgi:hypothetical protein